MYPFIEYLTHRSRRWKVGAVGLLLLALLVTCGPLRRTNKAQVTNLPQPVIDSLMQQPVWCFAEFSDGRMESAMMGYHPAPLEEAFTRFGFDLNEAMVAKEIIRCYTSWQAAFGHEGTQASSKRREAIEHLRKSMPEVPNEADYQVAVLYSIYKHGWGNRLDLRYSPPVTPQPWSLTEGQEIMIKPRY